MNNYEYFFSTIVFSVGYAVIVWPIAWFLFLSNLINRVEILRGRVSKSSRKFPQAKFLLMGSLDALASLLATIPVAYIRYSTYISNYKWPSCRDDFSNRYSCYDVFFLFSFEN